MEGVGTGAQGEGHGYVLTTAQATSGMVGHRVEVDPRDVVFIKGVVEASEGLATVFAESGGSLTIAAPAERHAALWELLLDLERHCGAYVVRDLEGTRE